MGGKGDRAIAIGDRSFIHNPGTMDSVSSTTGTELTRARHILGLMQKNLECPICLDLLKNPVSTRCDHQFCRFCILKALTGKQSVSCPLCKAEVTKRCLSTTLSLQDNTQLQQIIRAVQSVTEAVYKDTGQQKAPPVGSPQNCRLDQKEQREKRRHISTDSVSAFFENRKFYYVSATQS
ncbi:BRCA1 [Branchiostoma lanceolatum]|uniref:BRCA1 protein n=1 Tax=Branchiostoma lanceolatum TaxID=7740 RepID=A0A8J9YLV8_BRALA|nr:BRCA1 [Branchiostoma lanceolatum]